MEKSQYYITVEELVGNWNADFPNYPLTPGDFKIAHKVVGALFHIFDRLGMNTDNITQPPQGENRNEHIVYYMDLIPLINITRIVIYLFSIISQRVKISIITFLQPTSTISPSILIYLYNLYLYYEQRLKEIKPFEDELFLQSNQIKILEERKNKLLESLNEQAVEKCKRAGRLEKIDLEQKQLEEELKQEKASLDEERKELESVLKDIKQNELMLEEKRKLVDSIKAEVEKKRALRVYDAEGIKTNLVQVAKCVQEEEEKFYSLNALIIKKENLLKDLQTITRDLNTANYLRDVMTKGSVDLIDCNDFEFDHLKNEVRVFSTELSDLRAKYEEVKIAKAEAAKRRQLSRAEWQREKEVLEMTLEKAEQKEKEHREKSKKSAKLVQEIKELTNKYKAEKETGIEEMAQITNNFKNNLKLIEEEVLKKISEARKRVEALHNQL